jgi:hypothetical protein
VNNDATTSLHRSAWVRRDASTGAVADSNRDAVTVWRLARFGTITGASNLEALIFNTGVSNVLSFRSEATAIGSTAAVSFEWRSWGDLAAARLLSSLRFSTFDAGSDISELDWQIEGWVP